MGVPFGSHGASTVSSNCAATAQMDKNVKAIDFSVRTDRFRDNIRGKECRRHER